MPAKRTTVFLFLILLLAAGCSNQPTLPPMPTLPVSAPPTSTPGPTLAVTPAPLQTLTGPTQPAIEPPQGSPTPFTPFAASVAVDNLNLRQQPGHLSGILRMLMKDAPLSVLGQAPGGEWIYVQTTEGDRGWVYWQLISSPTDLRACPVVNPEGAQVVRGQLTNQAGRAVTGVQFALEQGSQRTDATTDSDGIFYAFFPPSASGEWVASYVAIRCESSLMDADCSCPAGLCNGTDPVSINFSLPSEGTLTFVWK